ncbi:hypothetical protein F2Q69_00018221 [Brassica cretica]|uniref:Uncharacterized protein n=1 Tax=Brassica cretica TaxID=69181 RepID=A0A8S9QLB3_BRACR|nr:hypothetical protein F2Q69_00018221 [Brassica cretica]
MVAQCLGAICGVGFVKAFQSSYYVRYGGGANSLADGYSTGTSLAVEIIAPSSRPQTLNEVQETPTFQRVLAPLPIGFRCSWGTWLPFPSPELELTRQGVSEQPLSSTRASHGMTTYDLLLSPFLFN